MKGQSFSQNEISSDIFKKGNIKLKTEKVEKSDKIEKISKKSENSFEKSENLKKNSFSEPNEGISSTNLTFNKNGPAKIGTSTFTSTTVNASELNKGKQEDGKPSAGSMLFSNLTTTGNAGVEKEEEKTASRLDFGK